MGVAATLPELSEWTLINFFDESKLMTAWVHVLKTEFINSVDMNFN